MVLIIIWLREKQFLNRMLLIVSIILGFMGTSIVPALLNINTMSSYAAGFAWEMVSTIQSMEENKKEKYISYLDDIFGEGATAMAVQNNRYKEQNAGITSLFNSPINTTSISSSGSSLKIIKKYVNLALEEPKSFLQMKWEFVSHSLGIGKPINMFEYNYNRAGQMNEFGFNDSSQREAYVNYFLAFMEFMVVFRRPWILYLVCLILILIWRFKFQGKKSPINLYEASFGVSVFYYGAYILNTQSFEFRYFFPSWLLLFTVIIGVSSQLFLKSERIRIIAVVVFSVLSIISFTGGYKEYTKTGDETHADIKSSMSTSFYNECIIVKGIS